MDGFTDAVAVVTGGSRGIGFSAVTKIAEAGARVTLVDLDQDAAAESAASLRGRGLSVEAAVADVSAPGAMDAVVDEVLDRYGRLDLAFNNAGISSVGVSIEEISDETWAQTVAVNLTGVWRSLRAEARAMRRLGGGSIVNTASICGFQVAPMTGPYNTTKHAVIGLTKEAAVDLAAANIRVNAVCPGYTHTRMSHGTTTPDIRRRMAGTVPLGRWAEPGEIADAVVWLLSAQSTYVTGHALVVDGGVTVRVAGPEDESS